MSSSLNDIHQFRDYRFGEQIGIATSTSSSDQQSASPQMSNSRRHPSDAGPLSPLQSMLSQPQSYEQPLTKDMLKKKDRLDLLLEDRRIPGVGTARRRRSISNGNIYRRLYNEDNSPMAPTMPFKKVSSEDSDVSVDSPNPDYTTRFSHHFANRGTRHNRTSSHQPNHHYSATSSIHGANQTLNHTNRNCSCNSIADKKQFTYSRSVNTSRELSYHNHLYNSHHPNSHPSHPEPSRRFSGLVRLSAAHIALNRTRKKKKNQNQTTVNVICHQLSAIASRVVNSRRSEPAETKMSIDEMISLAKYLYVLEKGYRKDTNSDSKNKAADVSSNGSSNPVIVNHPMVDLTLSNDDINDVEEGSNNQDEYQGPKISSLLAAPSNDKKKSSLGNLGNIFPFATVDRLPSISSSESEISLAEATQEPTELDRLLPPQSNAKSSSRPQKGYYQSKLFKFIRHMCHFPLNLFHGGHRTQIKFEGWSLFFFSPTSLTRLYLWKIVGSRWFEVLILLLLLIQWILMSFVPVLFTQDPVLFTKVGDFLLLLIYMIYTFELISKIIVYGFILNTHSHSKPNLRVWIHRICHFQRHLNSNIESVVLSQEDDDDDNCNAASNYIRSQHRQSALPSFANKRLSISSSAVSILSGTDRSYPIYHAVHASSYVWDNNASQTPSQKSVSHAETIDSANVWKPSSPAEDLDSSYNTTSRHLTQLEEAESEYAKSILPEAEQQVLASLNPYLHDISIQEKDTIIFLNVTHNSFLLSSFANTIDLISVASFWIDLFTVVYLGRHPYPILQTLAATRLLRLLVMTEGTAVIMKSLSSSYDMLKNVVRFFVFFWLLFSLVALFIFMNAFDRRCAVWPQGGLHKDLTNINYVEPRISCSGYMTSDTEITGPYDINTGIQNIHPGGDGLFCKLGQVCIQDAANQPEYGYMSYENILYTMLNVLTVISTENWTDLLYITQDSVSGIGAAIFYTCCIYLMTFIMVPMFIAVITTSFSHIRGDMRESAFSSKRKTRLLLATGKRQNAQCQRACDDDAHDEWIYEGTGLGGYLQTRSLVQGWAHYITHHAYFPYFGSILTVLNVVAMTFYNADMSTHDKIYYDLVGRVYTTIFAFEIAIRIYGCMHLKQFWQKRRNRTDLIIAVATVIDELSFVRKSRYHIYLLLFSVCRCYRLVYLFPGTMRLLSDVIGDGQGIINLTFFTFLVLLLLSPISVRLFGGGFTFIAEDEPSMRFDNSYQAFLALFQIMTGENWTDILYDAMHSQKNASVSIAAIYMLFLYFSVHYIVLNLFIAVIMENFDLDEEEIKQIQIKKYIQEHQWKPEYFKMDIISRLLLPLFTIQDEKKLDFKSIPQNLIAQVTSSKFKEFLNEYAREDSSGLVHENLLRFLYSEQDHRFYLSDKRPSFVSVYKYPVNGRRTSIASQYSNHSHRLDTTSTFYFDRDEDPTVRYGDEYELNVARENKAVIVENLDVFRSLIFFKKDNPIRRMCTELATTRIYNWLIVGLIGISTLLALWADESNREKHPTLIFNVIGPFHSLLLLIYWFDTIIRMIADGLFMLPKSYMRNPWSLLDMMNLTGQMLFIIPFAITRESPTVLANYGGYLRILRTLRSLRIVYYVEGMRVIFSDLVYGLPKVIDAVALNFLVFVPFAIYGCYLFSGRFFVCNDGDVGSIQACIGEFFSNDGENFGILLPRTWKNPYAYSFDTFGKSLLHLFECASGEGWILSLFSAMSVNPKGKDFQPHFNWSSFSIFHSLYYVIFMFVASLCFLQLFIGLFLETFKQRRGISTLTNTQRQFKDLQRQLSLVKPSRRVERPQEGSPRAIFYDLVVDKRGRFAQFMATILAANTFIFATEHLHQPQWLGSVQETLNAIFLSLYVFEIGAKIAGLGIYKWASARWNIYDTVLVCLAIMTSIPRYFSDLPFVWDALRRLCLVGIAFRLAQRNESLDTLFRSVKQALPSIFYVSSVFLIVIVCFGVTFQEMFSSTRYGPYGNEHANFRSLFNTILVLFRITTGENWDFLMHDFTVAPPECVGKDDCGSPTYAIVLFISFYVVCTYIFVNLFTVIVIDNFSFTFDKRNHFTLITRTDLREFKKAWSIIDPRATGLIDIKDVPNFLSRLEGALSIHVYGKEHRLSALLNASNQVSRDMSHLIAVPLSDAKGANNTMGERSFNLYELNKRLADINSKAIRERKRQYAEVYQEIINASSHRGIAFHQMLEILATRLVDVSKSLTFDELVKRARILDKIDKQLETERAKGLVNMLIQRRNYLKTRQKTRNSQILAKDSKNLSIVNSWLRHSSSCRISSISNKRPSSFLKPCSSVSKSTQSKQKARSLSPQGCNTEVPKIIVDQARQESSETVRESDAIFQKQQYSLQLPDRFAAPSNGERCLHERRDSIAIIPTTLGEYHAKRESMALDSTLSPTSFDKTDIYPPKPITRSAATLPIQQAPLTAHILGYNSDTTRETVGVNKTDKDIFMQYYASGTIMDDMTDLDAQKIVYTFEHNAWSGLLQHETYSQDD